MNIWELDKLLLFFLFFVPGFLALKTYDLCTPLERRDFSKAWFDAVVYSAFFACIGLLGYRILLNCNILADYPLIFYVWIIFSMFIFPIGTPFLIKWIMTFQWICKRFIHPVAKPWDYVFIQKKSYWIIVHLKDGRQIGGFYGENSFASSYPAKEQLYLEEVWKIDNGNFVESIGRTGGIILTGDEMVAVELFELEEGEIDEQT